MAFHSERLVQTAKPHRDESFVGYLTRLTEVNHYQSPTWILQLADLGKYERKEALAFSESQKLMGLSKLTGVNTPQLLELLHRRQGTESHRHVDCKFFGSLVPRSAVQIRPARICSACLGDSGYVRRIWELTIVTTCPRHKCLLVDACPSCRRRLPFLRARVGFCKCGYDLKTIESRPVKENEMELTRRVHTLCNLEGGRKGPEHNRDFGALELGDLIQLVSLVTSQYYRASYGCGIRAVDTTTQWLRRTIKLRDVHGLLCKTMEVFRDWPNKFYGFLEWRARHLQSNIRTDGVLRDFGELWSVLYRKPISPAFEFIREALAHYLQQFWQGGHASRIRRIKRGETRYVSNPQACKILGATRLTIDRMIESGKLTSHVESRGGRRLILISLTELHSVKAERSDLIDRLQTARRLGINIDQVHVLGRSGLLTERKAYDLQTDRDVFYSIKEIDALLQKVAGPLKRLRHSPKTDTASFAELLLSLHRRYDLGIAQLVQGILDQEIRPCHLTNGLGLRALQFRRHDALEYRDRIFRKLYPNALNTIQAAKALNAHPVTIPFLVKRKILHAEIVHSQLVISPHAVSEFCAKYVATLALAKKFETSPRYLTNILEMEGVAPVPESIVDGKPSYFVFKRRDIDRIKLDELIKAKRHEISLHSELRDIAAAADFLNTQPEILSDLAANGVITTWSSRTRQLSYKNCFTEIQLRRLLGKVESYVGLVTANVAAKICKRSSSPFNDRFVKTNVLTVVHVAGDRRRFFHRTEVEELAERMRSLVGAADVRATLKLSETQLIRLIRSGELTPVSGPGVDAFGNNLFSKADIAAIRKQRESFKRRRARVGGSQRFGKPAGPQRRPVLDEITPRVRHLIDEAAAAGKRMSAAAIYEQLIKEGHTLGINSVYVCIRKIRSCISVSNLIRDEGKHARNSRGFTSV